MLIKSNRWQNSSFKLQIHTKEALSLSSAELASLYHRESSWRKGKRKRTGDDGKRNLFPLSPARCLFFDYCYFYCDRQWKPLRRRGKLYEIVWSAWCHSYFDWTLINTNQGWVDRKSIKRDQLSFRVTLQFPCSF